MRQPLDRMAFEQEGEVVDIPLDLRSRLAALGLRVGKRVRMITREPLRGPVVVLVEHASVSLGIGIADRICVEVDE